MRTSKKATKYNKNGKPLGSVSQMMCCKKAFRIQYIVYTTKKIL